MREEVVEKTLGERPIGFWMAELISVDEAGHEWGGAGRLRRWRR
jgi:hypothetical protein